MKKAPTPRQVHGSSSSRRQGSSSQSEAALLELGRKISAQLDLEDSVDTLGKWMSHYVAELILQVEGANAPARAKLLPACREAILALWDHRASLPSNGRPLGDLDLVLRVVESLDPSDESPRYYRAVRRAMNDEALDEEAAKFVSTIEGVDYSAKVVIRFLLATAAERAVASNAGWIALAKEVGADRGFEFPLVRMVEREGQLLSSVDEPESRKLLEDRIARLEGFATTASGIAAELKRKLMDPES